MKDADPGAARFCCEQLSPEPYQPIVETPDLTKDADSGASSSLRCETFRTVASAASDNLSWHWYRGSIPANRSTASNGQRGCRWMLKARTAFFAMKRLANDNAIDCALWR